MNAEELCALLPRVADPLCRVLLDPVAAYALVFMKPCKTAVFLLLLTKHRNDMLSIMEALSVDMADRPLPEAIAQIPANRLHELSCLIADIYGGIASR